MTEQHEREWKRQSDGRFWQSDGNTLLANCMMWEEVERRLNEYETLKRATEALSAEDLRKMIILSVDDWVKAKLKAYADTLEGK